MIAELSRDLITHILKASKIPPNELLACCPEVLGEFVVHHLFPCIKKQGGLVWASDIEGVLGKECAYLLWPCLRNVQIIGLCLQGFQLGLMIKSLLTHLASFKLLQALDLRHNSLDSNAVAQLMPILALLPLRRVLLRDNPVGDYGTLAIALGLEQLNSLKGFSFHFISTRDTGGHISASTIRKLMSNLQHHKVLHALDLGHHCRVGWDSF